MTTIILCRNDHKIKVELPFPHYRFRLIFFLQEDPVLFCWSPPCHDCASINLTEMRGLHAVLILVSYSKLILPDKRKSKRR